MKEQRLHELRKTRGGALGKYLALLAALAAMFLFLKWKSEYGITGVTPSVDFDTSDYVAFVRREEDGATNLFLVRADGTDLKRLTEGTGQRRGPAWSPDGRQLCFSGESPGAGSSSFQVYIKGTGDPVQKTTGSLTKDQPAFRPGGRTIDYLAGGELKSVGVNGEPLPQVYPPPHKGGASHDENEEAGQDAAGVDSGRVPPLALFRWNKRGTSLAAVQVMEGEHMPVAGMGRWWDRPAGGTSPASPGAPPAAIEPEAAILLPLGDESKPALLASANKVGMDWLPDGDRLLLALSDSGGFHGLMVFRTDEQGLTPQRLLQGTRFTAAPENPSVSPDGSKVAFELWRMESSENRELLGIAVLPIEDGKEILLKSAKDVARIPLLVKGPAHAPLWSPDGSKLIYWKSSSKGRDLWVCAADGSGQVNLTKGVGDNAEPAWSPRTRR